MNNMRWQNIAIVGAGPSGASLAYWLKKKGHQVVLFSTGQRPPLIVGESLIPAVMSMVRSLGLESRVAAMGTYKGGALLILPEGIEWRIDFADNNLDGCTYAFNVPRQDFDALLLKNAIEAGVKYDERRVSLRHYENQDSIALDQESADRFLALVGSAPDLIVDATGRSRTVARLNNIPYTKTERDDIVVFTHFREITCKYPGYIHVDILENGWIWRIPLPNAVSVGGVFPKKTWMGNGSDLHERFYGTLSTLAPFSINPNLQCAQLATYQNYNLLTDKVAGSNWVLVGDAFGFVDPVFSSGVYLALRGSALLADSIVRGDLGFSTYYNQMKIEFAQWREIVESFYNGSFFSMIRKVHGRRNNRSTSTGQQIQSTISKIVSGVASDEDWSQFRMIKSWA